MLELCVALEEAFERDIDESLTQVKTVQDLVDLVNDDDLSGHQVKYEINSYPLPRKARHSMFLRSFMQLSHLLWRFEVSGLENIPSKGNFILAPNHQSYFDSLWILSAIGSGRISKRKVCCLAAEVFLNMKFMLAVLGGIPVERTGNTVPAMKRGLTCLQNGYIMLIHPEGTRTRDGAMHEFKGGTAKLALAAQTNIIPVRIDGAWTIFPPHKKLPKVFRFGRRYPLKITFDTPITPDGKRAEELTCELQNVVEQLGR